ncbi:hypothetical protein GOBAR_DD24376 [Gossypium barbadense]|nr:hypothetical protein GOBAR_DD24376 [Gossypium barbadense]
MEQENNKNEGDSAGVGLALSQASEKRSSNLSKAKSDIAKSMARNFLKTRKATHTSEDRRRNRKKKNKSLSEGSKATESDAKKQNSREENPQKDATTSMVHVENSRQIEKNEENTYGSGGKEKSKSIFKKAIKENYNKNNKFKTELTARQVRKLTKLFQPVAVHSTALPVHSPPSRAAARIREHPNREAHDRLREARPPSDREASARDPYANISARSYCVLSHERDRQITYGELASARREDIHRDLYLNENDYGAYGFQGERRNSRFQPHMAPRLGSYHRDYNEQPLCQPEMAYRESVPIQRNIIPSDPLYLPQREYRSYDLGATQAMQSTLTAATANTSVAAASTLDSYATDPYYSQYYGGSIDSYLPRSGGETHLIESDHLRRENNQVDRLYLTYASDALADYNQMQRHHDVKPVPASTSVSYRYSFTGASFSYL